MYTWMTDKREVLHLDYKRHLIFSIYLAVILIAYVGYDLASDKRNSVSSYAILNSLGLSQ